MLNNSPEVLQSELLHRPDVIFYWGFCLLILFVGMFKFFKKYRSYLKEHKSKSKETGFLESLDWPDGVLDGREPLRGIQKFIAVTLPPIGVGGFFLHLYFYSISSASLTDEYCRMIQNHGENRYITIGQDELMGWVDFFIFVYVLIWAPLLFPKVRSGLNKIIDLWFKR